MSIEHQQTIATEEGDSSGIYEQLRRVRTGQKQVYGLIWVLIANAKWAGGGGSPGESEFWIWVLTVNTKRVGGVPRRVEILDMGTNCKWPRGVGGSNLAKTVSTQKS